MAIRTLKVLVIAFYYQDGKNASGLIERYFFDSHFNNIEFTVICGPGNIVTQNSSRVHVVKEDTVAKYICKVIGKTIFCDFINPDIMYYSWKHRAKYKIDQLCSSTDFDYVHTISHPHSTHLLGLYAKQKYGMPWIAQFYDPLSNNPVLKSKYNIINQDNYELERKIASNADVILHTNSIMYDYWRQLYGNEVAKKVFIIPLVTRVNVGENIKSSDSKKMVISHIGNFTSYRNSLSFIEAVHRLVVKTPIMEKILSVNYVGEVTDVEKQTIKKYHLENLFNLCGRLSEQECEQFYISSDVFLVIDTQHEDNPFFPSKILKYFFYKKPILAITARNSVLKNEMINSNNHWFYFDDIDGIADYLYKACTNFSSVSNNNKDYYLNFTVEHAHQLYYNIIRK